MGDFYFPWRKAAQTFGGFYLDVLQFHKAVHVIYDSLSNINRWYRVSLPQHIIQGGLTASMLIYFWDQSHKTVLNDRHCFC